MALRISVGKFLAIFASEYGKVCTLRYANGNKVTYNYTTPVQNIGISLVWRFSGGKSVNVNAVENGSQSFKEVKDIR